MSKLTLFSSDSVENSLETKKNYMRYITISLLTLISCSLSAQEVLQSLFTEADTLRGMLRPERTCYDVHYYELNIKVDPQEKYLSGHCQIHFLALADFEVLQLDLYENMSIDKIEFQGETLDYKRIHDAIFVQFSSLQRSGSQGVLTVHYDGHPTTALNAPWDGGFVWKTDKMGKDWIGVACEGDGASLWWPNKDHLSDEPDSMLVRCAVPNDLMCVINGNLIGKEELDNGFTRFDWKISYPINNYNISLNIGDYTHFQDTYTAADGDKLALDYYVLPHNLEKAQTHFKQVHEILACFEQYFGKYPFWNDGYALVETPYLGMEHQGAIAYGNQYKKGYLGQLPQGFTFDFIILHETGHEYFGNSISCDDHAEMWIHEAFTTYMETLYLECKHDYDESVRYLKSQRAYIKNQVPMLGPLDVNYKDWGDTDIYYKGAWMLHTLRNVLDDDKLWFEILYELHDKYKISNVNTQQIVDFFSTKTKEDLSYFFDHYLNKKELPQFTYKVKKKGKKTLLSYCWQSVDEGFCMPIELNYGEKMLRLMPTTDWQEIILKGENLDKFQVDRSSFLVDVEEIL